MSFTPDCPDLLRLQALGYPPLRDALFRMDAERAHELAIRALSCLGRLPGIRSRSRPWPKDPVEVMGLRFENRLGLAAGLDKGARAIDGLGLLGFGFVEVGTATPRPQPGNSRPRLFRIPSRGAIINRMGFNNPGITEVAKCVANSHYSGPIGINIGKNADTPLDRAVDDYLRCFREAYPVAAYIAVNLSSPNTRGLRDLQFGEALRHLVGTLLNERRSLEDRFQRRVPLAAKIAPDLENEAIRRLGNELGRLGVDAVIATNTTIGRVGLQGHPLAAEAGGLSGAPLRERATEVIRILRRSLPDEIAVIGSGGIMSGPDAAEKIEAGAALVQIYTGLIYRGPALVREILEHYQT